MARPTTRRMPRLEDLEARNLLSFDVTSFQQMSLELINEARVDPESAAGRVEQGLTRGAINAIARDGDTVEQVLSEIANADPRPPVAWDAELAKAAETHTEFQIRLGRQTHDGPEGLRSATDRAIAAGYGIPEAVAENIIFGVDSPEHAARAFLADYGTGNAHDPHRENIQQTGRSERSHQDVGVAVLPVEVTVEGATPFGSPSNPKTETKLVVTQVFGRKAEAAPKLLGVVYDDADNDQFYGVGEGIPGAKVTITDKASGDTTDVKTWSSGGYQAEVRPGAYQVEVRLGDRLLGRRDAVVGAENTKVDFRVNEAPRAAEQVVAKPQSEPPRTVIAPTTNAPTTKAPAPVRAQVSSPPPAPVVKASAAPAPKVKTVAAPSAAPPTLSPPSIAPSSPVTSPPASTPGPVTASVDDAAARPRLGSDQVDAIDSASKASQLLIRSSRFGTLRSWWRVAELHD